MTSEDAAATRGQSELLVSRPAWQALCVQNTKAGQVHLRDLFAADAQRGRHFTLEAAGLYLDYSKNRVDRQTLQLLAALSNE
jgi:glucose-6-phosphate isomerase